MIHIVIASNEAYFVGLACSVLSIADASRCASGMTFHILDGGIRLESWELLVADLARLEKSVHLKKYELALAEVAGLPPAPGGVMTYTRLLMPSLIQEDEVIYVDSDILAFCDFQVLWEEPLGNQLAAACQDSNMLTLADDPLYPLSKEEGQLWYFNAGIMKINLKLWRAEDIQGKTLQLLREYGEQCVWLDQTALNYCLMGRVIFLDRQWNQFYLEEDQFRVTDFAEGKILVHYVTKWKPWKNYSNRYVSSVLWWLFFFARARNIARSFPWKVRLKQRLYRWGIGILNTFGNPALSLALPLYRLLGGKPTEERFQWLNRQRIKFQILSWFKAAYR